MKGLFFLKTRFHKLMKNFIQKLESELDSRLHFIRLENEEMIKLAELSLQESRNAVRKLKNFTMKYKFKSESEEIDSFKNRKSHFLSRMIYHNELDRIKPNTAHLINAPLTKIRRIM